MRTIALAVLLAVAASADVVEQGSADAAPSGLLAGVARADISPPAGIAQMNWGSQTHIESVAIDPAGMKLTALVLSDSEQKFARVDIDRQCQSPPESPSTSHFAERTAPRGGAARYFEGFLPISSLVGSSTNQVSGQPLS